VFRLALRQTEGLIGSFLQFLGLDLTVPDHSTLSRHAKTLEVSGPHPDSAGPVHLLVDSTGLQLCGPSGHPDAHMIVPPRSTAVLSETVESAPTQRDRHLQSIAEHGCMGWQKQSAYNRRALAETAVSRFKRVMGDGLRSRTDHRRRTEVAIAIQALNRMLELGRPKSVRIA
jgi:hypothetical protein